MKSGFAIIIGRSNVGKSTLLNRLIGTKLSIVTNVPQTTRKNIHGILNTDEGQVVFIDTPGVLKGGHGGLSGQMIDQVKETLHGIDTIIYVVDPSRSIGSEERYTLSLIRGAEVTKILVINKIDLKDKPYIEDYRAIGAEEFTSVIELSAGEGTHIKSLVNAVMEAMPEGEPVYPMNQRTNLTKEEWVAEIIREKALNEARAEVPYAMHVVVDSVVEKEADPSRGKPHMFVVSARILVNADRYKKMLIGTGGRIIKEIGSVARKELEGILDSKVFLDLEVETDEKWLRLI
ncbi:MAG: GTPase Era [Patescibacteria group bacterium]|nr:GTPase Era [Patescibacteria group bacterium]